MEIGSIYVHDEFPFKDGKTSKKLFIVVAYEKEFCLVCKTTSQEKPPYRIKQAGCAAPKNDYYMLFKDEDFFKKDTWIQFDDGMTGLRINKILQDGFKKQLRYKGSLKQDTIKNLLTCILKSTNIPLDRIDMIKETLQKL